MRGERFGKRRNIWRLFEVSLAIACLAFPAPLLAWWETGHQAIARIAAAHLTPAARTRIARILDVPDTPEAVADALAKASIWADETKNQTGTGAWHYIDLTLQDQRRDIPERCHDDNCAPARIRLFAAQLAGRGASTRWSDLDALRYVVHLVGDVHQPLHTISDADLGGNCEALDFPIGQAKNLHALWDGPLVNAINPDEKALAAEMEREIEEMSARRQHQLAAGQENDWIWESHLIAMRDVYHALRVPVEPIEFPASCKDAPAQIRDLRLNIGSAYVNDMKPVVRLQLQKAGLRLAKLLNQVL